ncbi:PREDICTED: vacuolar ATPase assembly integral membrane protein vma21-like [Priapulus caudatus]|uniref:Vacuolar ATPase assembly integral membrane protein vma21-like n=1 Tax=Priapulus caudatus TaxID=37621 RepID=A0ABM1F191_PRICU|nr:PREDICTED: vacuolar ATPase assembly integral membrane protein vma21-like [Priapulus caudatus]
MPPHCILDSRDKNPEVLGRLFFYSLLIIVVPVFLYFFSKFFIFEAVFLLSSQQSYIYAAIVAVVAVHAVLALFIWKAIAEDSKPIKRD